MGERDIQLRVCTRPFLVTDFGYWVFFSDSIRAVVQEILRLIFSTSQPCLPIHGYWREQLKLWEEKSDKGPRLMDASGFQLGGERE